MSCPLLLHNTYTISQIIRLNACFACTPWRGVRAGDTFDHDMFRNLNSKLYYGVLFLFYNPIRQCLRALVFDNNNIYYNLIHT